ncbi:putative 39S ribosomal protein L49, mitochondrial [Dirofilaria immitis]|nr:putative 39S ribosomal protein L49, mitochondrial [Dirofilaria immitis]
MDVLPSIYGSSAPPESLSSSKSLTSWLGNSSSEKIPEEEGSDAFLLEAMICSICFLIFDEPKQLECGHSFCAKCIDQLYNVHEMDQQYTCPLCRAHFNSPPVVNYSLKEGDFSGLISRIKEKDAMVKYCHQCSKATKPEDQYCCDDCNHINRIEGHAVSKFGDLKERIKTAQQELQEMINATDIEMRLEHARRLHGIYMRRMSVYIVLTKDYVYGAEDELCMTKYFVCCSWLSNSLSCEYLSQRDLFSVTYSASKIPLDSASEFAGFVNNMFNEIRVLVEKTGVELAGYAIYGDIVNKKELIEQSAQEQTRSWFEYQRTGRVSALCSALARRNAAIARRHIMTCTPRSEEIIVNVIPPTLFATSTTSILPVSGNGIFKQTRSEAVEISIDWKYVERLLSRKLIPDVPKHDKYPTPSGWRPPNPRPDLTFYVERNRDHLLPLYLETRRDQLDPKTLEFEYVELVLVKKIHGDVFECERKMREYLEEYLQHPIATHVDELKGFIRIKGADRAVVEQCLYDFGFEYEDFFVS